MTKPDYSEYLTPPHLVDEEVLWGEVKQYELYAALANKVIEANNLSSALRLGVVLVGFRPSSPKPSSMSGSTRTSPASRSPAIRTQESPAGSSARISVS
jgi:hypothetical protein